MSRDFDNFKDKTHLIDGYISAIMTSKATEDPSKKNREEVFYTLFYSLLEILKYTDLTEDEFTVIIVGINRIMKELKNKKGEGL